MNNQLRNSEIAIPQFLNLRLMKTIVKFCYLIIFVAFCTVLNGQNNKFIISPKVGLTFNNNQLVVFDLHSPFLFYGELDLQYKFKKFGVGIKTSMYKQNSVTYSGNLSQNLNPNVHEYFIFLDPWYQSSLHINYWSHSLYGFYTLNLGSKLSLDLRTGISWIIGEETRTDFIADGNFKPTRTSYWYNYRTEPNWYRCLEFNYQLSDNIRVGLGVNDDFYRWATYASFGVSF